jgi:hypothetical protein
VTENNRPLIKTIGKGVAIPTLTIGTSYIASDNTKAIYSNCSYCSTTPINSNCPRLSSGTNYKPILGSTISNIDSKDTFTMVVVLENIGHSGAYDVTLQGSLSNVTLSPTSTLCITRLNGTSVNFIGTSLFDGILYRLYYILIILIFVNYLFTIAHSLLFTRIYYCQLTIIY